MGKNNWEEKKLSLKLIQGGGSLRGTLSKILLSGYEIDEAYLIPIDKFWGAIDNLDIIKLADFDESLRSYLENYELLLKIQLSLAPVIDKTEHMDELLKKVGKYNNQIDNNQLSNELYDYISTTPEALNLSDVLSIPETKNVKASNILIQYQKFIENDISGLTRDFINIFKFPATYLNLLNLFGIPYEYKPSKNGDDKKGIPSPSKDKVDTSHHKESYPL